MSDSTFITPIQLASLLEEQLKPITGNNVPPQMIYNYLKNDVRKLNSFATKKQTDGKKDRILFEEKKAEEFIQLMVSEAKKRVAKKKEKEANQK